MRNVECKNPVIELINMNKEIDKIYLQKGLRGDKIGQIISKAKDRNIKIEFLNKYKMDKKAESNNHQGVIALTSQLKKYNLKQTINYLSKREKDPLLLILDHIQDPHNFGAIIRTAYAAGVDAIIYPKDRACKVTATVDKVSTGAVEYMKLVEVVNINRVIDDLKERYYWIAGADMDGKKSYYKQDYKGKFALVVGNEGSGLNRLTK